MKQKILLLALIFCSSTVFGQTTTLTYTNAGLGSNCNIFNPTVTLNNIQHLSRAGGVTYTAGNNNGLVLESIPSGPTAGGTAFVINYSFAGGFNYTVAINARGDNVMALKATVVSSLTPFSTASTSSCTADAAVLSWTTSGTGNISVQPAATTTAYTSSSFAGSAQPYLVIWAFGGPANLSLDDIVITSIVITKTATTPSFTLPSTTNVQCGSTSPITFTVTNVNNTPNVTDYTWNLGATPNGWLYNGSPAPQTVSTGTTGSIALTPTSGTLSSISATATVGGNTYNTNSSVINVTAGSYSITGSNSFCSNETYSINVPSGASVTWSASPSSMVSFSGSGSTVTVSRVYPGTFSLTAAGTACGHSYTVTKSGITGGTSIDGSYSTSYDGGGPLVKYPQEGYNYITEYSYVWAYVSGSPTWSLVDGTISSWNYNGYNLEFYLSPNDWVTFRATVSSGGCTSSQDFTFIAQSYFYYSLAPNPASSELTIYVDDEKLKNHRIEKSSDQSIQKVIIMDKLGNAIMQQNYPPDIKKVSLNVSGLSPDMYLAKIYNGKKWTSIKFIKK